MKLGRFDIEKGEKTSAGDSKGPTFGKRHVQVVLLFLLVTTSSCTRINLSVGMDAMTDSSHTGNPDIPTYNWDNKRVILTSFYWGFGILQVIGAQMGKVYGTKWLLAIAMSINCTAFVLIPLSAQVCGSTGVVACRVVQGLAQGFFYPSIHSIIGQWVPPTERLRSCVTAFSGTSFSNIVVILLTRYVSTTSWGWPVTFYFFGILGFLWVISWILFGYNSPEEHKTITEEEKKFIETSLGMNENAKFISTPWGRIFTSLPVWATVIAYLGQTWGTIIIQTEIPTYMREIMKMDIESNSLLASAPYLATFYMCFVHCYIANYLIVNKYVTKLFARKLFTTIGMVVPATVVIVLGFLPEDARIWAYALLITAAGSSSAMYSGHAANVFDLTPTFPGIIKSVANSISNIFNILPPFTVEIIVRDETDQDYWRIIFGMSTTFYVTTTIVYFIFASGDLRTWDPLKKTKENAEEKEQPQIYCLST